MKQSYELSFEFNHLLKQFVKYIESESGLSSFEQAERISDFAFDFLSSSNSEYKTFICSTMYKFFEEHEKINKSGNHLKSSSFSEDIVSPHVLEWCFRYGKQLFENKDYENSLPLLKDSLLRDPDDTFGARDYIPVALIHCGLIEEADSFLNQRIKVDTFFLYNRVLADFLLNKKGDLENHIKAAYNSNAWITNYLTARKKFPKRIELDYSECIVGTANEARCYLLGPGTIWFKQIKLIEELDKQTRNLKSRKIIKSNNPFKTYGYSVSELNLIEEDISNFDSMNHEKLLGKVCKWSKRIFQSSPWLHIHEAPVYLRFSEDERAIVSHFTGSLGAVIGANVYLAENEYKECIDSIHDIDDFEHDVRILEISKNVYSGFFRTIFITREPAMRIPPKSRALLTKVSEPYDDGSLISPDIKHRGLEAQLCNKDELGICLVGLLGLYHAILHFSKPREQHTLNIQYEDNSEKALAIKKLIVKAREKIDNRTTSVRNPLQKFKKQTRFTKEVPFEIHVAWLGEIGYIKKNKDDIVTLVGAVLLIDSQDGQILSFSPYEGEDNPLVAFVNSLRKFITKSGKKPKKITYLASPIAMNAFLELEDLGIEQQITDYSEVAVSAAYEVLERCKVLNNPDITIN
jgi:hypothetical protein